VKPIKIIMKKNVYALTMLLLLISGCDAYRRSEIEGTWQLIYARRVVSGIAQEFKYPETGKQYKMFDNKHVMFFGRYEPNDSIFYIAAYGTYEYLDGVYHEQIEMNNSESPASFVFSTSIKNDTLIQSTPDRDRNSEKEGYYSVYVRVN
jgi:hypothetical protein